MRPIIGAVVRRNGSTMRVLLENGLTIEAENTEGFGLYTTVSVHWDFTEGRLSHIVLHVEHEEIHEENANLDGEVCHQYTEMMDDDDLDHDPSLGGADCSDFDYSGSENLALTGDASVTLGSEYSENLAPFGASSETLELELIEINELQE